MDFAWLKQLGLFPIIRVPSFALWPPSAKRRALDAWWRLHRGSESPLRMVSRTPNPAERTSIPDIAAQARREAKPAYEFWGRVTPIPREVPSDTFRRTAGNESKHRHARERRFDRPVPRVRSPPRPSLSRPVSFSSYRTLPCERTVVKNDSFSAKLDFTCSGLRTIRSAENGAVNRY